MRICFLQTEWKNDVLLKHLSKMTPNRSGKWKNMEATADINKADVIVVIDYTSQELPKGKPVIYIGGHPTVCPGHQSFKDKECIASFNSDTELGFIEWWLKDDYDTLSAMKSPEKTKDLSCILSNQRTYDYHRKRIEFMTEFCNQYPGKVDIYGRIKPQKGEESLLKHFKGELGENIAFSHWYGKKAALAPYRYSLEFDMGSSPDMGVCRHYFSERLVDSLLMWCMPFYYGGINTGDYIPGVIPIDPFMDSPEYILNIVNSNEREHNIDKIAEARNLLLNRWQIWPRIYNVIKGVNNEMS